MSLKEKVGGRGGEGVCVGVGVEGEGGVQRDTQRERETKRLRKKSCLADGPVASAAIMNLSRLSGHLRFLR